ncbi:Coenzyme PQQ synthesis protein D (PqqD) [Granulicella pectinivorans]|uniref:Coenzyme PQQ synthesis protein D (PqqD) n=1 Tax=Granulicella pectinivorans TaxID=474950 RepID=A0A1I6M942_9BACT|nr:PqqD family protein [Granulicella pectinivorans]SFS12244.1 Coenzyme PQQ synthesis protein D (PqqD) [Granulicella pectinivorans]
MLTGNTTVQRVSHTIDAEFQDSLIMLDPVRGKYLALNAVGRRIWQLLEEPTTVDRLSATLLMEFDVPPTTCLDETRQLLERLSALELLQIDSHG